MLRHLPSILLKLSRASVITVSSSICALLELWVLSSKLHVHDLGVVLAAQGVAALLAAVGEAGFALWVPQRLAHCATPLRLTALSRYAVSIRLPLFAIQTLLIAIATRYTIVGWNNFGLTLIMSASMAFSFGWVFISSERYVLIALTESFTRAAGLLTFMLLPTKSAGTALVCLGIASVLQSAGQLVIARRIGLLAAVPIPRLKRLRIHARHFAAYRSAIIQAAGRNILPVSVGAAVAAPLASPALAAEKVSRAAMGIVSAVLGYILPTLGRDFRERPTTEVIGVNLFIAVVISVGTMAALKLYIHVSHASLAQLFSENGELLTLAAALTGVRVAFSATLYMRVLAAGNFVLATRLLLSQTVGAVFATALLREASSVAVFLFTLALVDLLLATITAQLCKRPTN
ncbi:hypothetical protein R16034_04103 [Ralstonia edaphis]|uniref:Uncharacterized protein n=1 Tax=Ralstonia edaphi TaxID=3058599 RepID=A0AB72X4Z5_9RALS|nr:hypothetical protein R16034_04103 [Ralstonia sp. LMG 6871]